LVPKLFLALFFVFFALASSVEAADSTPPVGPSSITTTATTSQIAMNATSATDAQSGIAYYMFAIGSTATTDYGSGGDVQYWQVSYAPSLAFAGSFDPAKNY